METNILIRLILAHLLSDFVFQSRKWAEEKDAKGFNSGYLYLHILVTGITALLLVGDINWLLPIALITVIHGLLDGLKSEVNKRFYNHHSPIYLFVADQVMHILIIGVIWIFVTNQLGPVTTELTLVLQNQQFWLYLLGYTLVTVPIAVLIGKITEAWSIELNASPSSSMAPPTKARADKPGLQNAGKWIGIIERILILTFVLNLQFAAIGFMLAAKSVFRFGDLKDSKDHQKTEYIIIGTFLSFMLSILTGIAINYLGK
ncbi:MAG TPA: DUF3307 domain-containing protein [Prolixibacteraceae bacterium]|jgi:hypothetical protein